MSDEAGVMELEAAHAYESMMIHQMLYKRVHEALYRRPSLSYRVAMIMLETMLIAFFTHAAPSRSWKASLHMAALRLHFTSHFGLDFTFTT